MLLLLFNENIFVICIGCHQEGNIIGHLVEGELANGVMIGQSLGSANPEIESEARTPNVE